MKRGMEGLNLQKLGRNYFDSAAARMETNFHLEVWPGYVTSIRQHENSVLMNAEVVHRVLRSDSILDQIRRMMDRGRDVITRSLMGMAVITRYNNKPYRIDDVDWERTPRCKCDNFRDCCLINVNEIRVIAATFTKKDGSQQSYADYYLARYQATVQDLDQPLLVSMPKERDLRGGRSEPVLLVPELCNMTGIDDVMRVDFKLMRV